MNLPGIGVQAVIVSLLVALTLSWVLTRSRAQTLALDQPNERSLHRQPVPRTGGLAIVAGMFAGWLLADAPVHGTVIFATLALSALSFLDDMRSLPVAARLVAHLAAAAIVMSLQPGLSFLLWIAGLLGIAWMINLYNFMDGSDGLAGGMAAIGFLFFGVAAWQGGDAQLAWASWIIAAAAAGFLVFNFHPARIFMGDSGSVPLGFVAAVFAVHGWSHSVWPLWFPLLVFSPFIVDASVTLVRRLWQRERVWQAHREHYYQRLVQLGWGHRRTALVEYGVMAACGAAGLYGLASDNDAQSIMLGSVAMVYMFAILAIDATWRTFERPPA